MTNLTELRRGNAALIGVSAVTLLGVSLAAVAGLIRSASPSVVGSPAPQSLPVASEPVAPPRLDLGEVARRVSVRASLPVRNRSKTEPLTIDRVQTTCSCTSVSPRSFTLAPGEEIALDLAIVPPLESGADRVRISLISNGQLRASSELALQAVDPVRSLERTEEDRRWLAVLHEQYRGHIKEVYVYLPLSDDPVDATYDGAAETVVVTGVTEEAEALDFVFVLDADDGTTRIVQTVSSPHGADL